MTLQPKDLKEKKVNCDHHTMVDFAEFRGEDLFEVADYFWEYVADARRKQYMIYAQPMISGPKPEFEVYDNNAGRTRRFLNFCSYNYLGYSFHPEVIRAVQDAVKKFGTGAVSAPLLSGYSQPLLELEAGIADIKNKDAAIVFSTGYGANVGILSSLLKPGDIAVLDILSHASIYDGVRLSGAEIKVFSHNNPRHLDKVLKSLQAKRVIVCVEGVYSMDGDLANLPEIVPVCQKYNAKILVDEAHASLVFGKKGGGVAEHYGLEDQVDIAIGTFSKSFGAIGGYAAGEKKLMTFLRMFARSYVFSCAMAPHTAVGILKALDLFQKDPSNRERLWDNTRYMHTRLKEAGLDIGSTKSQVIPVMAGSDLRLREISRRIQQKGLYSGVVTYPAVSKNKTRLRLSVSAAHTKEHMDRCVAILQDVFESMKDWRPE
ncbi:MAG: aminotransferase class I/II-fold pyridoxal phosphate-dependent enzyme [Candidatus Aminicenantes bacterium]